MRLLVAAVLMCVLSADAKACPPGPDVTIVRGAGAVPPNAYTVRAYEQPRASVSPRPSFFVRVGREGRPGFPDFTRPDGSPIPIAHVVLANVEPTMLRIDLDIDSGVVIVRIA